MHKSTRLFPGKTARRVRWMAICTAMIVAMTALSLPLFASGRRDGKGMMGEIRDGVRQFGREVSDMVDPDGDGILPDGSVDNGIQNDGNQNGNGNGSGNGNATGTNRPDNTPSNPSDTPEGGENGAGDILPGVTDALPGTNEDGNDPTPGTDDTNRTDEAAPGTTAPTTTTDREADTTDSTDGTENAEDGGFRWMGIIIALVVIAAVVGIIILLIPKRKD